MSFLKSFIAAVLMLCSLIETGLAQPPTTETTSSVSKTGAPQPTVPDCVNSESDVAEIKSVQKANYKTPHKYDGYRNIFRATTDLELAARLAYAETVAANCSKQEDQITDLVTSVIGNRVRIRHGDVKGVVFQKDQFASSLNIYPESHYRDFLCPNNGELWNKVLAKMRANLEDSKPGAPIPKDTVNYYLYQHSERLKAPAWKLEEVLITDKKTRECIRVFRDPAWK